MAPLNDPRKEVGNIIKALSKHMTNESECRRRFSLNWNKKEVYRWVEDVEKVNTKNQKGSTTFIKGTFVIVPGVMKMKRLHVVTVKAVDDEEKQQFLSAPENTTASKIETPEPNVARMPPENFYESDNNNNFMFENDNNFTANYYFNEGMIFAAKRAALAALDDTTRQLNFDDATTKPPQRNN